MEKRQHGGNIKKTAKELGIEEKDILDFSANINPLGLPDSVKKALYAAVEEVIHYPDPDCGDLKEAIGRYHRLGADRVACGNGGADLLYRMAYGLRPKKGLLPAPTFTEYEDALRAAGTEIAYYPMKEDFRIGEDILDRMEEGTDLIILCNPNNPTGLLTEKDLILRILDRAGRLGARVMVDECFLDLCEEEDRFSLIPCLDQYPRLMILKSFTKLYAMPGVRLGYMLCGDETVCEMLDHAGQAWPVSSFAQRAGLAALLDSSCKDQAKKLIREELAFMKEELSRLPLVCYDGKANYLFFRAPGREDLDVELLKMGIMIRNCSNYVGLGRDYWRVAVRTREENLRLLHALAALL